MELIKSILKWTVIVILGTLVTGLGIGVLGLISYLLVFILNCLPLVSAFIEGVLVILGIGCLIILAIGVGYGIWEWIVRKINQFNKKKYI